MWCVPHSLILACCRLVLHSRKKLGVDGNLVEDLIITWCCPCCAISQEARALGLSEPILFSNPGGCFAQLKPGAAPLK